MKQVSHVISLMLNPFIMPFLGVLLAFKYHEYFSILYRQDMVNTFLVLAGLLTILFPFISIFLLYKSNLISDLNLSKREERFSPAVITLCYYLAYYYFLTNVDGLHSTILAGYLGGCVALLLSIFITLRWKISLHTQGISSLAGMFLGISKVTFAHHETMIISLIICIGLVGTSRLILEKHTPIQVLAGSVLGFSLPYLFVVNNWVWRV